MDHPPVESVEEAAQMRVLATILRRVLVFQNLPRYPVVLHDRVVEQSAYRINRLVLRKPTQRDLCGRVDVEYIQIRLRAVRRLVVANTGQKQGEHPVDIFSFLYC